MGPEHISTVLFVTHDRIFGGSAVSLYGILRELPASVRRVVAAPDGKLVVALAAEGLVDERVAIPATRGSWPRMLVATVAGAVRVASWSVRRRRQVTALHANGLVDLAGAAVAAALCSVPVVVWVHDTDAPGRRSRRLVPIARSLGCRVTLAAVSQAGADALVDAGVARPGEVTVVANPIDPATVVAEHRVARVAGEVRVGFVGTDTVRKGFDLLPSVVGGLDPAVRLLVFARHHAGGPPEVEAAWDALAAHDEVELVGRQDDVRVAYARCDVVLCPSRQESFCRVAAEAMANGIPVVASDLPPVREVLGGDEEAGLLVPPGNAAAAAAAVTRLARDAGLRERLGRAGRARARRFAPAAVVARLTDLYGVGGASPSGR